MPRNPESAYPLSSAQERMWFLCEIASEPHIYNNPLSVSIESTNELSPELFEKSLKELARRHEILRTTFALKNGAPMQFIKDSADFKVEYCDLRDLPKDERRKRALEEAVYEGRKPIDIKKLPLLNFKMLRMSDNEYIQLITPHHIISDGWSNMVFAKELGAIYNAFAENKEIELPEPQSQYIDYVKFEKDRTESAEYKENLKFWKELLAGDLTLAEMPLDFKRPPILTANGATFYKTISAELTGKLRRFSQNEKVTLFHSLFAVFNILIYKYANSEDIIIGVPSANRSRREFQSVLGLFMNTLPVRTQLSRSTTFLDYLAQVRETTSKCILNQELPFERLIGEINPKRDLARTPLFQIMFVHQNMPMLYKLPGMLMKPFKADYGTSKFDLNLWLEEVGDEILLSLTYNTDLFKMSSIERLLEYYESLIDNSIGNPDLPIGKIDLIGAKANLDCSAPIYIKSNDITTYNIIKRFSLTAQKHPNLPAVAYLSKEITYKELVRKSDQIALLLIQSGAKSGDVIAFFAPRNENLLAGILGILKAGCAYLPLDTDLPHERLKYMLDDSKALLILAERKQGSLFKKMGLSCVCIESHEEIENLEEYSEPVIDENSLAYIVYTSGTTGYPKGVCISHSNLINYVDSANLIMNMTTGSRFALMSTPAADLGNTMIFPPLAIGGCVIVINKDMSLNTKSLAEQFDLRKPDCMKIVPSHIKVLIESPEARRVLPSKLLVIGGEACQPELIQRIREINPQLRIINHYGPSETTVGVSAYELPEAFDKTSYSYSIPIGKPFSGNKLLILDSSMNQMPIGVPGEICIAGKQVSAGYLNKSELTCEKFVPNPFNPDEKLYKTGDKGRFLDDGNIEFLGRFDNQIKIRGFRIELGEIEKAIARHNSIERAVALKPSADDPKQSILCFIKLNQNTELSESELHSFLKNSLPDYALPSKYIFLNEFPITPNGKLSIEKLRKLAEETSVTIRESEPPTDEIEIKVAEIWSEALKIDKPGIDDNFFELGGHSLLAVKVLSSIEKTFNTSIPLSALFSYGSVRQLAGLIRNRTEFKKQQRSAIIKKGSDEVALWLVHPAGGNVLCYGEFAKRLASSATLWGVQATTDETSSFNSIEEMAEKYLEEIKPDFDKSRKIIGGWSMGALVAYEIARLHYEQTDIFTDVLIFDQPAFHFSADAQSLENQDIVNRLMFFAEKAGNFAGVDLNIAQADLTDKSQNERAAIFYNRFVKHGLVPADITPSQFDGFLEMMIRHNDISAKFAPKPYLGNVFVFKAQESLSKELRRNEVIHPHEERSGALGWEAVALGKLKLFHIPGNHVTIMAPPHVKILADAVSNILQ